MSEYKRLKIFSNYSINEEGKIYSNVQNIFRKSTINANGCHNIWLSRINEDGVKCGVSRLVHNIVAQYFLKKPKNKKVNCVRHKDGNKSNNHVSNLEWVYIPGVTLGADV